MRKRMVDSVDKKRKKTNTCDQVSHEGSNENQQSKKRRYERVSWQFRYDQLVEFRNQFGHTNVPQNYAKNMKLAAWVKFQRSQYKTGTLIQERINQLNELSFVWDLSRTVPWQFRYDQLVEFRNQFGHTNVPQNYAKNMKLAARYMKLGRWVHFQRSQYKTGTLIQERIDKLDALGFTWSMKTTIEFERRKREADKEEAREVKRRERVKRVNQVILKTTKTNRLGAEQLVKTVTNMVQAIHTRTRPCTDHFVFDPNPQGSTANKLIRKLRHNNGNGQYATCVFSIDEELEFNCAFAITTIGACGAPITQLIPLSEMVVYCRTNGLDELIPFFESIDTQINFANAIVQLVPKLTAVVQQGTPTPDRNIMKPVLQAFFHGLGGENNDYKPIRLQPGNTEESKRKMVSARMVTASIYLPNGKMNIVCNQMYHNQISEQARNICQRMNQSTTSREPGNITFFLDFPRQPYKVRKLAADMMKID